MPIKSSIIFILVTLSLWFYSLRSFAGAEATATASLLVREKIELKKDKDLSFPETAIGDEQQSKKVVNPSDPGGAIFSVKGLGLKSYTVTFLDSQIDMVLVKTTGTIMPNRKIRVYGFTTDLANNAGQLNESGVGGFRVGATRGDIKPDQVIGSYQGEFKVRVQYLF